jgi:hypothetical protein
LSGLREEDLSIDAEQEHENQTAKWQHDSLTAHGHLPMCVSSSSIMRRELVDGLPDMRVDSKTECVTACLSPCYKRVK